MLIAVADPGGAQNAHAPPPPKKKTIYIYIIDFVLLFFNHVL